jgi:hypothetical protein
MNKFQKKVMIVVASAALLLNGLGPVLASTTILVSGNGSDSENTAKVDVTHTTSVVQSNNAEVSNTVDAKATTGGNEAKGNTGGDVSIKTGDAGVTVSANTTVNSNAAKVDCCNTGNTNVEISGNGTNSENKVNLDSGKTSNDANVLVQQTNSSDVKNRVDAKASTGDNKAKDNTNGDVSIETGDASTSVTLDTTANANSAQVGGGSGDAGSLSAIISGNGSDSENKIKLGLASSVWFTQDNNGKVDNNVDAKAETGDNQAKDNTGGESSIKTGDATNDVSVDNSANFNWASGDCGCLLSDLLVKVAGNGVDSENKIIADLGSELGVAQGNCADLSAHEHKGCELKAHVETNANSGDNEVKDSTGSTGGDPSVSTGDASSTTTLATTANSNVYGQVPAFDLPSFDFHFSFDLSDLLNWLGAH